MTIGLEGAAQAMAARVQGAPPDTVSGYSTDSRTVAAGDLFFALRGEVHDGHDHAAAAAARGAVACVVEREIAGAGPQLVVGDTLAALQALARWAREQWGGTVVGVTGSAGKTTAKDAIAAALGAVGPVSKTEGNLNNHIGLPLSLLRVQDDARWAVIEMGMNHAGEIRQLAGIARQQVAVVTNAGMAHIEHFGSPDAVAAAKREIIETLPAGGVAVLNGDDPRVRAFAASHAGRSVLFGRGPDVDVRAEAVEYGADGARFRLAGAGAVTVGLPGPAGVMAGLAALATAQALGLDLKLAKEPLARLQAGGMRLERLTRGGMTVWNDCYNANPEAVRMMLELLAATPAARRIAVLGEMRELGTWSERLHAAAGRAAAERGIDIVVGVAGEARALVAAAAAAGCRQTVFFETPAEAGVWLRGVARPGDALLFKGSRGTHVEVALQAFWK